MFMCDNGNTFIHTREVQDAGELYNELKSKVRENFNVRDKTAYLDLVAEQQWRLIAAMREVMEQYTQAEIYDMACYLEPSLPARKMLDIPALSPERIVQMSIATDILFREAGKS